MARTKAIQKSSAKVDAPNTSHKVKLGYVEGHRRKKIIQSYKSYIYKILKQIHPQTEISSKAMQTMNDFVYDLFERIANEAAQLCQISKRPTLMSKDFETACKLILPGELSKHAVNEATKALTKYNNTKNQ